jgi:hypothetical protein
MAGITAFYSLHQQSISPEQLLQQVFEMTYPLPGIEEMMVDFNCDSVAFGGTFPKHYQRKKTFAAKKELTLLFYGELYNELGHGDEAEFALNVFSRQGIAGLAELNGPFTLFCWNAIDKTLIAATDRLGRFPIFYFQHDSLIGITSDLHPLFAAGIIPPILRVDGVVDFLTIGFPLGNQSLFEGVTRLSGGEYVLCSHKGIEKSNYWKPVLTNSLTDVQPMVEVFRSCNDRAIKRRPRSIVALSGGWDTRATLSAMADLNNHPSVMTFGNRLSTDVVIASRVAEQLGLEHEIISEDECFFSSFPERAKEIIILGSGHATIDLAFQMHAMKRLAQTYSMILDSAGCEFRRGIRAKIAAQGSKSSDEIAQFLLSMYSTGVWNGASINSAFFQEHEHATRNRLTNWLESLNISSSEEKIDAFSWQELWCHGYAHGHSLQTSTIACHMPYSDNEFYDLFLQADRSIRWSHKFHFAVIRQYAPQLARLPISYGHVKVPFGEGYIQYLPVLYHQFIDKINSVKGFGQLRRIDNFKPYRPYQKWYANQLEGYACEMLSSSVLASSGYVQTAGIASVLNRQKSSQRDFSHGINILLTLAHLLEYQHELNTR